MSNLTREERDAIVTIRVNKAWNTLHEAKGNIEFGFWSTAANRLYYACYNMVSALMIKHGHNIHTHSGIIRMLGLHFVSTGILSKESGRTYSKIFELRQSGDYDDWREIEEEDVKKLLLPIEMLMHEVETLINASSDPVTLGGTSL